MIYKSRKGKRKTPARITREDIEKAMREFKGEIQRLEAREGSPYESNPTQVANPFGTLIVGNNR